MPIAPTTHSVAAVVNPRTDSPSRMIAPAPRKPMPVTICAAIRVGSVRTTLPPLVRKSWKPYAETIVKSAAPSETRRCVRTPASRSRISRSTPTAAPRPAARSRRTSASRPPRDGRLLARSIDRVLLYELELLDPALGEVEQLVELLAVERHALRSRLHLDEAAVPGRDDVQVDVRARVLGVVEVEQQLAVDDPDRDRGDGAGQHLREGEAVERAVGGDVRAADRGAARAAVGLEHVPVQVHRPLAEGLEVDDAAERATDQPLDLDGAAALSAARRLALRALAGRGRQQRVLRRHPAAAAPVQPARHALGDRRGAEDARPPLRPEHHPVRLLEEGRVGDDRAQLVGAPAVAATHAARSSSASETRSTA